MNKTAIKNFAIWARVQLIEAAKQRAYEYEITENGENKPGLDMIGGRLLTADEKKQRQQLISQINAKGYTQVMEEAAYTWFNRFIALRYMEVNGFLPSKVRVFTDENGAFKPEILKEAMTVEIDGLDRSIVLDLLDKQNNELLYKYLLITQCNALNQGLPYMFEKISNWTELLFPANLLRPDSVLGQMVTEIPEEDWQDAVQIIGWMYQYYNSELKDDTFALLKKNVKITKERIPAATQLFTPDWIVRYMVENSLGRLYINDQLSVGSYQSEVERIAAEKALAEKMGWKYYLPEAEQDPEVRAQLNALMPNAYSLTTLKVIDPCMGSGHILVYAFDVLLQIYTSCGWSERDAAKSIIENNLYGLDIDDRAGQLAYFAVMMKARKYSRRILNGETKPNVLAIQDSGFMTDDFIAYVAGKDTHMKADLNLLRSSLKDAKEYGSIINMPKLNFAALYERIDIITRSFAEDMFQISYQNTAVEQLLPLVKQAEMMAQKYDVAVTNPPYMGQKGMNPKLDEYLKKNYFESKSDLFAVFAERLMSYARSDGYVGMMTPNVWMFISSYQYLREVILNTKQLLSLVQLSNTGFSDAAVSISTFVFANRQLAKEHRGSYIRLKEYDGPAEQERGFLEKKENSFGFNGIFTPKSTSFSSVEGSPITFWVSDNAKTAFTRYKALTHYASPKQGMATMDTDRFLKMWHEVNAEKTMIDATSLDEAAESGMKWFPIHKGGPVRKWFGNNTYVVNWYNDGKELKDNAASIYGSYTKRIYNTQYFFQEGATWSAIAYDFAIRYFPSGYTFSNAGMAMFTSHELLVYLTALLNSKQTRLFLSAINESVNFNQGDIAKLPVCHDVTKSNLVVNIAEKCVNLSKQDWDRFEESWDFKKHPLI